MSKRLQTKLDFVASFTELIVRIYRFELWYSI